MQHKTTGSCRSAAGFAVTIMLRPSYRAILRDALLDELGLQAEHLDHALEHADRLARPQSFRRPCGRIIKIAALLDGVGWADRPGNGKITLASGGGLSLVRAALRNLLACAEDNVGDARTYGNSKEVQSAEACLQDTSQTLREIEVQATGARTAR